jgi:thiol-disulfide isomerase/thioredoxin
MIFNLKNILLLTMAISTISCGLIGKKSTSVENKMLPEMALITDDGKTIQLSSLKGKKVFVNLWATWCPPCVAEMPSIQQLYATTGNNGTEFVMISFDKNFETAKKWVKQKGLDLPVYAVNGDLPELFNVEGIPSTFIFDEEGKLIYRITGSEDYSKSKFINMLSAK